MTSTLRPLPTMSPGQPRSVSVASVTVSWNPGEKIVQHLRALAEQTQPLDEMIVVDNASTDGTTERIRKEFPNVTLVSLSKNLGVGGGGATGIEKAIHGGCDWVWLFDQDTIPNPRALSELLEAYPALCDSGEPVGILHPLAVDPHTGFELPPLVWRHRLIVAPLWLQRKPVAFVDSVMASGSLISRELVEEVGLPRKDFFMDFVDHEFALRVRRRGYRIAVIRRSCQHHSLGSPLLFGSGDRRRYWAHQPAWRHYYAMRNEVSAVWHDVGGFWPRYFLLVRMVRRIVGLLLFGAEKSEALRMLVRGCFDGFRNRLGVRFQPCGDR